LSTPGNCPGQVGGAIRDSDPFQVPKRFERTSVPGVVPELTHRMDGRRVVINSRLAPNQKHCIHSFMSPVSNSPAQSRFGENQEDRVDNEESQELTQLLSNWSGGDKDALDVLVRETLPYLRSIARSRLNHQASPSLSETVLVNDLYVKLVDRELPKMDSREHFFATVSTIIRNMIVDYIRRKQKADPGGKRVSSPTGGLDIFANSQDPEAYLLLHRALEKLETLDPRQAKVVELRQFLGLNIRDTGKALNLCESMVRREWTSAKAWLGRELGSVGLGDGLR